MTRLFSKTEQASVFMSAMLVMTKHNIPIAPADEFADGVEMLCSAMCDMLSVINSRNSAPVFMPDRDPPIVSGISQREMSDLLIREIDAHRDARIALAKMGHCEPSVAVHPSSIACGYQPKNGARFWVAKCEYNGVIKGVV